jgi:hypothetical protein
VFKGEYILSCTRYTLICTKLGAHLAIALDGV